MAVSLITMAASLTTMAVQHGLLCSIDPRHASPAGSSPLSHSCRSLLRRDPVSVILALFTTQRTGSNNVLSPGVRSFAILACGTLLPSLILTTCLLRPMSGHNTPPTLPTCPYHGTDGAHTALSFPRIPFAPTGTNTTRMRLPGGTCPYRDALALDSIAAAMEQAAAVQLSPTTSAESSRGSKGTRP
eukprot:882662-Rhodomonas_salina.8